MVRRNKAIIFEVKPVLLLKLKKYSSLSVHNNIILLALGNATRSNEKIADP